MNKEIDQLNVQLEYLEKENMNLKKQLEEVIAHKNNLKKKLKLTQLEVKYYKTKLSNLTDMREMLITIENLFNTKI